VNQIAPSGPTATSLGEFNGSPSTASSTVSLVPVTGSIFARRAGDASVPCSQTSSEPSGDRVMPLAAFASSSSVVTCPVARSSRRIATRSPRRTLVK
jgi:hypothetical protein